MYPSISIVMRQLFRTGGYLVPYSAGFAVRATKSWTMLSCALPNIEVFGTVLEVSTLRDVPNKRLLWVLTVRVSRARPLDFAV